MYYVLVSQNTSSIHRNDPLTDSLDLSHLTTNEQSELIQGPVGQTSVVKHFIPTMGAPICQSLRRLPEALKNTTVQHMLDHNIVRPSNSPWSSPVVMVQKKTIHGNFVLTILQKLNAITHCDAHLLERIDSTLDLLAGGTYVCILLP